ncbi:trypsin-like peptidase domain-containing protein [Dyella jejuensis]|uniref:Trypsin-like peptidase domain-containing protein n=1 Tax=Dyella jejuensis TaxID=1432009 RepID=A0ABW8JK86_9GAMM
MTRIMSRTFLITLMSGALFGGYPHQVIAADGNNEKPTTAGVQESWGEVSATQDDPAAVSAFWSYSKMKAAEELEPSDVPPSLPGQPDHRYCPGIGECPDGDTAPSDFFGYLPAATPYEANLLTRVNGILFFVADQFFPTLPDVPRHCSASVIQSQGRSLVLTAAHCIKGGNEWSTNLLFVPAYNGSLPEAARAPYGKWVVKRAYLPDFFLQTSNDIAVLSVYPQQGPDGEPVYLQDAVHGGLVPRPNDVEDTFPLVHIYGYPGNNWNGKDEPLADRTGKLSFCLSTSKSNDSFLLNTPNCGMQVGNSGGPSIIVHENSSIEPPEVVATVYNSQANARLLKANFCPIYRAADQDAAVIDPDAVCLPQTGTSGSSHR